MWRRAVKLQLTDVSEVRTASISIALVMAALRISETSVNFNVTTRRYIPEDSKLHIAAILPKYWLQILPSHPVLKHP
jgi:hypothetical protein